MSSIETILETVKGRTQQHIPGISKLISDMIQPFKLDDVLYLYAYDTDRAAFRRIHGAPLLKIGEIHDTYLNVRVAESTYLQKLPIHQTKIEYYEFEYCNGVANDWDTGVPIEFGENFKISENYLRDQTLVSRKMLWTTDAKMSFIYDEVLGFKYQFIALHNHLMEEYPDKTPAFIKKAHDHFLKTFAIWK